MAPLTFAPPDAAGLGRRLTTRSALATLGAVALVGLAVLTGCGKHQAGPPNFGPPEVGVVTLQAQPVDLTTELPGRTVSYMISDVRPQVGGVIKARLFVEGANVRAGQPLYQIDPAPYKAAYDSQVAALAKAEANLATVKLKAERYADLVKLNAVSKQDYNDAVAAAGQAQADVASAKAALQTARINLAYTRVTSPITGRAGPTAVTPGALVTADQTTALTTVQTLDPIYVDLTQSSAELLELRRELASGALGANAERARVKLILEDGSAYPLDGELRVADVTVDPTSGAVKLRAVFPNPHAVLLPGMFVRAVINEAEAPAGILAPQAGITHNAQGQAIALVVNTQGKVEQRVVQTSRTVGGAWLVTSGLSAGDRLIVEGVGKVKPGMAVKVVAAGSKPQAPAMGAHP
ncbi:MAG TPA: efflux RND transporter periplasmic adaptor subunit [Caulobacteraceae bacterium]|jgi:membrane fusion protein (multidrug efflux system)|nr:efflux RND transporter periplasmic adaptor subunit [Caulobacteraceae bacterium]